MPSTLSIATALAAILQRAGSAIQTVQQRAEEEKAPGALVTAADKLSHEIIAEALARDFPGIPLVMEEQSNSDKVPATCLVIDELDGTALYARAIAGWSVSAALVEDGRPVAGAIFQPDTQIAVRTALGSGTWIGDEKIAFKGDRAIGRQIVIADLNRHTALRDFLWARALSKSFLTLRCLSCTTASTIEMLRGGAGLFLNSIGASIWDFAACALAVEEAGGMARDLEGVPLRWERIPMAALFATDAAILEFALSCRPEA